MTTNTKIASMDADEQSFIRNCHLIMRHAERGPYVLRLDLEKGVRVRLDGYLICPKELFTPRQLKAALKRYEAERK